MVPLFVGVYCYSLVNSIPLLPVGLHQEGLFRVNGSVRAVDALRQRLERCEVVDLAQESEVCTVASLLKQFLRDLPEGLVNSSVQAALIQQHQGELCL